jgi:NTP pyrophosphatase (non-canonical NTP hydrolase)
MADESVPFWMRGNVTERELAMMRMDIANMKEELGKLRKESMNAYQDAAMKTAAPVKDLEDALLVCSVAIAGEAGELLNDVKKIIWQGHVYDRRAVMLEMGDILWYMARLSKEIGVPLSEVARLNQEKLNQRYPAGFEAVRSMKREEADE